MSLWIMIAAAGVLTYAIRLSFIAILHRVSTPAWFRSALRFVPPAVLTAIIAPELLMPDGKVNASLSNHELIAGVAAALIAWRTRNAVLTIVVGMALLLALNALF